MVLVVIGHFIYPFLENYGVLKIAFLYIYTLHMPAFIFISGYFYKNKSFNKIIIKYFLPYILFQIIYFIFLRYVLDDSTMQFILLNPYWTLWFLLSLFWWNILAKIFSNPKLITIFIFVAIGVIVGYYQKGYFLGISKTLCFFPFFLTGMYFRNKGVNIRVSINKSVYMVGIFFIILLLKFFKYIISPDWLFMAYPYSLFEFQGLFPSVFRLATFLLMAVSSFCFLNLVPKSKIFISQFGTRTLNVYIAHTFIFLFVKYLGLFNNITNVKGILVIIFMSILISFAFASKSIQNIIDFIIKPVKLLKFEEKVS